MDLELVAAVEGFIQKNGKQQLLTLLNAPSSNFDVEVLTIICNTGLHPLQSLHKRGEVFSASTGSLDFSTEEASVGTLTYILERVAEKLRQRSWKIVCIVPFGLAVLSMHIKALVYRVLNIDTIEVLHAGGGAHFDIQIDIRNVALAGRSNS